MEPEKKQPDRKIYLGMPGYGSVTPAAGRGFWRATRWPNDVHFQYQEGSLLAQNFNALWCRAMNLLHAKERVDYFAMQHADVEPEDFWLDLLVDELESKQLDLLGVVVPFKDTSGNTSIALDEPGSHWSPKCRLTMQEIYRLPETFTSADTGYPILINTGLWVCRFGEWAKQVHFTINDRIVFDKSRNIYRAQVEPEDWFFSRLCHELGLKVGVTRKIKLTHRGQMQFSNTSAWGQPFDHDYVQESLIRSGPQNGFRFPHDVDGWLGQSEGEALAELARGKRVLEIGSYCGKSTICLAQTAEEVHAVDPHDGRATPKPRDTLAQMVANLRSYSLLDKVTIWRRTLASCLESLLGEERFDFIFIDGAHDYDSVHSDITHSLELLAPGGLIAFHDYRRHPGEFDGRWDPGVTKAVDELLASGGELLSTHDSLAVVRPSAEVPIEV